MRFKVVRFVALAFAVAAVATGVLQSRWPFLQQTAAFSADAPPLRVVGSHGPINVEDALHSLDDARDWINSAPIAASTLRGKVVLVNFGTFTCINWIRQLPHVREWASKYGDEGLAVIGVHTPEFSFESHLPNVQSAMTALDVRFPVAVDSDRSIWRAFRNEYWPALYLLDAHGAIRHVQVGEGEYDLTEARIRELLAEVNGRVRVRAGNPVEAIGLGLPADWDRLRSTETYLGYLRSTRFSSVGGLSHDRRRPYALPDALRMNEWALAGTWTVGPEAVRSDEANGRIALRFQARDLHLVMGPAADGEPLRFRVLVDGKEPGPAHGLDVDERGYGNAESKRLHQLVRQPGTVADHVFEIEFLDPGASVYAFTFG